MKFVKKSTKKILFLLPVILGTFLGSIFGFLQRDLNQSKNLGTLAEKTAVLFGDMIIPSAHADIPGCGGSDSGGSDSGTSGGGGSGCGSGGCAGGSSGADSGSDGGDTDTGGCGGCGGADAGSDADGCP